MPLPPSNQTDIRPRHRLRSLTLLLVWFVILAALFVNRQSIIDWWKLRGYQAPANISQLATQATMTDYGRKIFYVNRPAINDKAVFSQSCPDKGGEQTIVLGCYHDGQNGIFLLNVNDPRLNGVVQVTAAHEMLHAAYNRLSQQEKDKVDAMLQDYYKNDLKDERIISTIEAYKKSEPNDVVNEMHSIFGTEIANLPAPLEAYYRQYFTNRAQIAAFAAQYQGEFTGRQATIAQYDSQLSSMKDQINQLEADLKAKQERITYMQSNLNDLRRSDVAAYNAGVPAYNAQVDSYNAMLRQINSLVSQYNQLVATRNALAQETEQLTKELSGSSQQPINN